MSFSIAYCTGHRSVLWPIRVLHSNKQKNRANAVQAIFLQNGISTEIITTKIFGEEKPETDNETEIGRQLNRRATIDIFKKIKLVAFQGQIKDEKTGTGKRPADERPRTKKTKTTAKNDRRQQNPPPPGAIQKKRHLRDNKTKSILYSTQTLNQP